VETRLIWPIVVDPRNDVSLFCSLYATDEREREGERGGGNLFFDNSEKERREISCDQFGETLSGLPREEDRVALAVELRQFTDVFNFASDKRYFGTREHRDGGDSSSMPDKKSAEHCCSVSVTNNVEAPATPGWSGPANKLNEHEVRQRRPSRAQFQID
jgi:hypothetical protein